MGVVWFCRQVVGRRWGEGKTFIKRFVYLFFCLGWAGVMILGQGCELGRPGWFGGLDLDKGKRSIWFLSYITKDQKCKLAKPKGLKMQNSQSNHKDHSCQLSIPQGPKFHFFIFKIPKDHFCKFHKVQGSVLQITQKFIQGPKLTT